MKRRNYTPNDNQNVIRMLAVSFARSAKGRERILFMTVVLSIITLTMVFGISRGKIRSEELNGRMERLRPELWKAELRPNMHHLNPWII